jgi:signal transduction histidine kinase
MGGYRSLKRVLGESNLERKCRRLFGLCVGGLILLAFWWVDWIAEDLIDATAQSTGRHLVRTVLFDLHWQQWTFEDNGKKRQQTVEALTHELRQEGYSYQIIGLDSIASAADQQPVAATLVHPPESPQEREILLRLKKRAEEQLAPSSEASRAPIEQAEQGRLLAAAIDEVDINPVFEPHRVAQEGRYDYYQVVYWSNLCLGCHEGFYGRDSQSAAATYAGSVFDPSRTPFRVIRIRMPDTQTRTAINRTRAILLTVGILTVFLAMVALYYVVKYIMIKPLTHLRDVSDVVAQGNLDQRADIHTNDEFEDLAASFNKMLVHLVETQGELRETNVELDQKVDELARLNMQLHEMNRLKGEFLANMSHELRTPLNSIIGFSEVLQSQEALSDKQKRFAQNIQKAGRQLMDLINDILDLAKMEAGKMEVRLSEFRIDNIIHAQCDLVRSLADEKNIDVRLEIEPDMPLLYQDQTKVQQILTNLLSNAIKFTPEGGRITVGARADARGWIEFWVSDTGVGIPASEKEIIFEKFRQGKAVFGRDNLTREYSGTGLGLSIVRELCKLLGGEVSVESELGKGSTFRVVIPWIRTDTPAATAKLAARLEDLSRPRRPDSSRAEPAMEAAAAASTTS